jgi:hypothetical protein
VDFLALSTSQISTVGFIWIKWVCLHFLLFHIASFFGDVKTIGGRGICANQPRSSCMYGIFTQGASAVCVLWVFCGWKGEEKGKSLSSSTDRLMIIGTKLAWRQQHARLKSLSSSLIIVTWIDFSKLEAAKRQDSS